MISSYPEERGFHVQKLAYAVHTDDEFLYFLQYSQITLTNNANTKNERVN